VGGGPAGPEGRSARREEAAQEAPREEQEQATENATARSRLVDQEEVAPQPFVQNGVRFSTQFRPA
jgi:hypothetical protein